MERGALLFVLLLIPQLPLPTFYPNMAIAAGAVADFPSLTFSGINCNSLNMSASSKHNQLRKIYGITKLKTDIIFLSDIQICNKSLVSGIADITKTLSTNPTNFSITLPVIKEESAS